MNILIPMAGLGSRFKNTHSLPKPLIDVNGRTMIERAIESLDFDGRWLFVVAKNKLTEFVRNKILRVKPDSKFIEIDYVTEGPAVSALLFRHDIDTDDELIIANCDQIMEWDSSKFLKNARDYDGAIVTFYHESDRNSYARINERGLVVEVREKEVISKISLNGIHYWKHGKFFVSSADEMIAQNSRAPNGEFYVGPTYNYMINKNQPVGIYHIPNEQHHNVGVPEELAEFLAYENRKIK